MTMMIPGRGVELEAVLRHPQQKTARGAAVLCHPHPVYGGTMNNRVIFRAGMAATEAGLLALRFNFRGVGDSTGNYDEGKGEQEDVGSAIDWLRGKAPGLPLVLIGFSFGAWVGLQVAARDSDMAAMVGLGLPLNNYNFDFLLENYKPSLYVIGSEDEFCPREKMERLSRKLPAYSEAIWIEGADHFFASHLDQLQERIRRFLQDLAL
jgi:uncharacterized protein